MTAFITKIRFNESPPTNYKSAFGNQHCISSGTVLKFLFFKFIHKIMTGYAVNVKIPETNFNYTN